MKAVESVIMFICLITIGACIDDDLSVIEQERVREFPLVDQALWPHFEAFEEAARERGFNVDLTLTDITGAIEEIHDDGVAGTCTFGGRTNLRDITIDESFWNQAPHLIREYIIFHELGHCFLGRGHTEACLPNRTYASMMRSGNGTCRDNYHTATRSYYIDELFGLDVGP